MDVVAEPEVIESIQERGGPLYVWPRKQPESLHLELGRQGHIRAFWNGLAWIPQPWRRAGLRLNRHRRSLHLLDR